MNKQTKNGNTCREAINDFFMAYGFRKDISSRDLSVEIGWHYNSVIKELNEMLDKEEIRMRRRGRHITYYMEPRNTLPRIIFGDIAINPTDIVTDSIHYNSEGHITGILREGVIHSYCKYFPMIIMNRYVQARSALNKEPMDKDTILNDKRLLTYLRDSFAKAVMAMDSVLNNPVWWNDALIVDILDSPDCPNTGVILDWQNILTRLGYDAGQLLASVGR